MKTKFTLKKLIYNDRVLMILSIILAIIVWYIVGYIVSPETTDTIKDIPITFDKTSLEKLGLSVISGQNQMVDIDVKGNKLTVGELTPDNFIAKVSMVGVDAAGKYNLEVQVSKKYQNTDYDIVQPKTPILINVVFDKYISKKISLNIDMSSVSAPDGYIMEKHYITPGDVTISGPEVEVSRVAKCMVLPELPEVVDKTYIVSGDIALYDVMGKPVDMTNLKLDKEKADVTIPVLKKKILPIEIEFINIPTGFPITDLLYTLSVKQIEVAGPAETIDTLSKISVGYLDLKLLEPDSVFLFDVDLPEGFVNIQNVTTVKADFSVADFDVRKFSIKSFNIINEPENYTVKLETKGINNVKIVGPPDVLDLLTVGDIIAEVDLSDRDISTGGQHNVPVQIVIPSRGTVWAIGDYTVIISLKEK